MLTPNQLIMMPGLVLLEAKESSQTSSGILIEKDERLRYPDVGLVWLSSAKEDIRRGDLVLIENEGMFIPRTYYDVFKVVLRDVKEDVLMTVDSDAEPHFSEMMRKYEASPSEWKHMWIELTDVTTDEKINFNPSDVVEFGFVDMANPTYTLEYIPTVMMDLWTGERSELFYLIDEKKIMAILWREEDGIQH